MFSRAMLARVELLNADLSHSSFHHSDWTGAMLDNSTLYMTGFWGCRLEGVDFSDADTTQTDFIFADLTRARITKKQLQLAYRLQGARLPNGEMYNGSFNLSGDVADAKAMGIDITDPIAMTNFYAMTEKETYSRYARRDRPEYTDWGN